MDSSNAEGKAVVSASVLDDENGNTTSTAATGSATAAVDVGASSTSQGTHQEQQMPSLETSEAKDKRESSGSRDQGPPTLIVSSSHTVRTPDYIRQDEPIQSGQETSLPDNDSEYAGGSRDRSASSSMSPSVWRGIRTADADFIGYFPNLRRPGLDRSVIYTSPSGAVEDSSSSHDDTPLLLRSPTHVRIHEQARLARAARRQIRQGAEVVIPRWQPDAEVTFCPICRTQFS